MSTVTSATSAIGSISAGRTAIQIAVPVNPVQMTSSDAILEAAVQRVASLLYQRSHCIAPPDATDLGGGVFNVLV